MISKSSYLAYRCNSKITKTIKIVKQMCFVNLLNVNILFDKLLRWSSTNLKINRCNMWISISKCDVVSFMINFIWSCLKSRINIIFTSLYLNWMCCQTISRERLFIINEQKFYWIRLNSIKINVMFRNWCQMIAFYKIWSFIYLFLNYLFTQLFIYLFIVFISQIVFIALIFFIHSIFRIF